MKSLLAHAHVVTMDDAGTEHPDGWILVENGLIGAIGAGAEPTTDERSDPFSRDHRRNSATSRRLRIASGRTRSKFSSTRRSVPPAIGRA